jgi:hypothetical protein
MTTKITLAIPKTLDGLLSRYRAQASGQYEHKHPELEMNHVIRGEARYRVASQVVTLRARDVVWVFPLQEHGVLEQSDDFEMWIGCFRPRLTRRICTTEASRVLRGKSAGPLLPHTLAVAEARRLCGLLAEVSACAEASTYNAGLAYLLLQTWFEYERAESRDEPGNDLEEPMREAEEPLA